MGLLRVTEGYRWLEGITRDYKGLQRTLGGD